MHRVMARRRARLEPLLAAQAGAAAGAALEIADLTVYRLREPVSGRSWCVVQARTRSGATGYGECAQATDAEVAAARRLWVGRPATAYATGPADAPLAGAVDTALLDIAGQACKAPVYRLLGGPTRSKARAYASAGSTQDVRRVLEAGYRAVGVPVPPPAARNQGAAYQLQLRQLAEAEATDFVLEGGGRLTAGDAARAAAAVEPYHPLWFDEPCAPAGPEVIRKIAEETVLPLGFGREIRAAAAFQDLLRAGCLDVARPDLLHFGITPSRRIAALAETYYVAVAPRHAGGPIATAAALQLAASLPNFFIQQIPFPTAEEDRAMRAAIAGNEIERVRDGFAALPAGPGLGIAVNQAALEKYHAA